MEIDQRPDKKGRQDFTGAPVAAGVGGRVRRICRSPCSLVPRGLGGTRSLYGVRVGACPEVGHRGSLGGGVFRGHPSTLLLLTTPFVCSRLFKSCSWVIFFNLFAAFVQNLSPLTVHVVHFRPII